MIVDVHNHFQPREWIEPLLMGAKEKTVYEAGVPRRNIRLLDCQFDERVEGMDRAGIDVTLLYRPSTCGMSLEDCTVVNNFVGEAVKKYPKRLVGTAHIPPMGGKKAFDELKRCVHDLGLKAVHLDSSFNDTPLDSREMWSFYREVSRLDLPIFVHPAMPMDYKLCRDYDLQRILGREFDLMLGATRMIYGGVFEEFPGLKVVFSHLGGGISGLKGRLRGVQPWVRHSDKMKQSFDAYFGKIYFDTAGFLMSTEEIKCALINIGPDRLMFGTDYPADYNSYEDVTRFKDVVLKIPMEKENSMKVMSGNAARLLKL